MAQHITFSLINIYHFYELSSTQIEIVQFFNARQSDIHILKVASLQYLLTFSQRQSPNVCIIVQLEWKKVLETILRFE